jgi:glycosyltransferase involved in cell wall biosynthesis
VPFYTTLGIKLGTKNTKLTVLCQNPIKTENDKGDNITLFPAPMRHCKRISVGRINLHLIPLKFFKKSTTFALVNSNANMINYIILSLKNIFGYRVCMWGHTRNHQKNGFTILEYFKKIMLKLYDHYFAYTENEKDYLLKNGIPRCNITVINNAIETQEQARLIDDLQSKIYNINEKRSKIEITYCGALYNHKRLDVLISAFKIFTDRNVGLRSQLNIIGDGPERINLEQMSHGQNVKFHGYLDGDQKLKIFAKTFCFVNPGLVGLGVFDGFIAAKPLIACTDALHSPEISYLTHNYNGILVDGKPSSIADAISDMRKNLEKYELLCRNARATLNTYNLPLMIENTLKGLEYVSKK